MLTVKGEKKPEAEDNGREMLYRGIAARAFERRFPACRSCRGKGRLARARPPARRPRARHSREQAGARTIPIGKGETPQIEATIN